MLFCAIFFISLSTLAFEVLLTRVFSIGQWNHLSFMVISIALFGFAASGTFLCIVDTRHKTFAQRMASRRGIAALLGLYSASAILSFLGLNHLPLDYFRLAVEPGQIFYLLTAYLLLALPFFFSGALISIAYMTLPEKTGLVYFATMAGSALGALMPGPLLVLVGEGRLIIISALIPLIPALFSILYPNAAVKAGMEDTRSGRILGAACGLTSIFFAIFILGPAGRHLILVRPSPYKALSQIMQFPATRITETKPGIRGRIERIQSPYIRYAPGLSLKYTETLPAQSAVFKDGDSPFVLYDLRGKTHEARFAKHLLSYAGYSLRPHPERVLLIISGGGSSIPGALAAGAENVAIVEPSPQIAEILNRHYKHNIINQNPRTFLSRDDSTYDIIQIENWGTSVPGTAALNQEHVFTIEAFAQYLRHLKPEGVVVVSRKLLLPPSDSLRLWAEAYEALARSGVKQPAAHLAVLRNFDTFTLIVSKSIIDARRLTEFAEGLNFDLVYLDGLKRAMANRFNIFDKPYHFEELRRLADMYRTGSQADYYQHYLLDVAPQSDGRPFPARFLKWNKINGLYRSMGSRLYALFMSGEIVVVIVFFEAFLIALVLMLIPFLASTRGTRRPGFWQFVYFFAVGTGFMFIEIYFIKRFVIVLGDPVVSFIVVIAGILFFSCLGGVWAHHKPPRSLGLPLAILASIMILEVIGLEMVMPDIIRAAAFMQYVIIALFLLPAGLLMGLPFPLGMKRVLDAPGQRAYAWSVNGCASVLSAIAAAQVAISWGIGLVAAAGAMAYLVAALAMMNMRRCKA